MTHEHYYRDGFLRAGGFLSRWHRHFTPGRLSEPWIQRNRGKNLQNTWHCHRHLSSWRRRWPLGRNRTSVPVSGKNWKKLLILRRKVLIWVFTRTQRTGLRRNPTHESRYSFGDWVALFTSAQWCSLLISWVLRWQWQVSNHLENTKYSWLGGQVGGGSNFTSPGASLLADPQDRGESALTTGKWLKQVCHPVLF